MCDQIKSYFCKPTGRLQYDNWKHRNDSKQIRSNLKWEPTFTSSATLGPTCSSFPRRVQTASKPKLKKTVVSNDFRRKQSTKNDKDRNFPSVSPFKNVEINFGNSALKNPTYNLHHLKYDSKNIQGMDFKADLSDYDNDSDEYSSGSVDDELFLTRCDPDDLEELKSFRDKFYFECHSLEKKLNDFSYPEEHVCQHQFIINDRLFPEPVYADHYKNSRCSICHLSLDKDLNEPIADYSNKNDKIEKAESVKIKSDKINKNSKNDANDSPEIILRLPYNKFQNIAIPQCLPSKSCINSGIKIKKYADNLTKSPKKQETPSDSLALRYQKGFRKK